MACTGTAAASNYTSISPSSISATHNRAALRIVRHRSNAGRSITYRRWLPPVRTPAGLVEKSTACWQSPAPGGDLQEADERNTLNHFLVGRFPSNLGSYSLA